MTPAPCVVHYLSNQEWFGTQPRLDAGISQLERNQTEIILIISIKKKKKNALTSFVKVFFLIAVHSCCRISVLYFYKEVSANINPRLTFSSLEKTEIVYLLILKRKLWTYSIQTKNKNKTPASRHCNSRLAH